MKRIMTFALLVAALFTLQAQELVQKERMLGSDGFTWYKMKFKEGDNILWAASNVNGKLLTPIVRGSIVYQKGGFFELTEKMPGSTLHIHWLYNTEGVCVLPKSRQMNVLKIDLDDELVVCWRYDDHYITVPGSVETYSLDGTYYALGDWSCNRKGFEENRQRVSKRMSEDMSMKYDRPVRMADPERTARPAEAERPTTVASTESKPEYVAPAEPQEETKRPVVVDNSGSRRNAAVLTPVRGRNIDPKAESRETPAPAVTIPTQTTEERPLFSSRYVSGPGRNLMNGVEASVDENLKIMISIYEDRLVENGFVANYVGTEKGKMIFCGGFVGMTVTYIVDRSHNITKKITQVGSTGDFTYEYKLTVK